MAIERLILGNLRKAQAFDRSLTESKQVDSAVGAAAESILYERDSEKRKGKIKKLTDKIGAIAEKDIIPQAEKIGADNALSIISATPPPIIAYHGSNAEFDRFKVIHKGASENKYGPGIYFTEDRKGATAFIKNQPAAGATNLYRSEVLLTNPFIADGKLSDASFRKINAAAKRLKLKGIPPEFKGNDSRNVYRLLTTLNGYDNSLTNKILRSAGFDGVKDLGEFVLFDPKKATIKSVKRIGASVDEVSRKQALFNGRYRAKTRIAIIKQTLEAQGAKLHADLERYWLEPAEGTIKDKIERMREIHATLEKRRKEYERQVNLYLEGNRKDRPSAPKLDFVSELALEAKKEIRKQARRTATDIEVSYFKARGHKKFVWITPNGESACPDCVNRQGVVLTDDLWERYGRPGSGMTVCRTHCFCMLLPEETLSRSPSLTKKYANSSKPGPLTSAATLAVFNANRVT